MMYSSVIKTEIERIIQIDKENALIISNNEYKIFDIENGNILSTYKEAGLNCYFGDVDYYNDYYYDNEEDFREMSSKEKRFIVFNKKNNSKFRAYLNKE